MPLPSCPPRPPLPAHRGAQYLLVLLLLQLKRRLDGVMNTHRSCAEQLLHNHRREEEGGGMAASAQLGDIVAECRESIVILPEAHSSKDRVSV